MNGGQLSGRSSLDWLTTLHEDFHHIKSLLSSDVQCSTIAAGTPHCTQIQKNLCKCTTSFRIGPFLYYVTYNDDNNAV